MELNGVDCLLLDFELYPDEIQKIEEGFSRLNGVLKGTFGTDIFLVGLLHNFLNFSCNFAFY